MAQELEETSNGILKTFSKISILPGFFPPAKSQVRCFNFLALIRGFLGPVAERKDNSISGIIVPYFMDNFIPGINSVPERKNNALEGVNLNSLHLAR